MKRLAYALAGVVLVGVAGFMIYRALNSSLVYFILPNEYAKNPNDYHGRRIRLGGLVEAGSVHFDENTLQLTFLVTDSIQSYPVHYTGAPPDLFKENTGVVVEGHFSDNVFLGDNLLIKHSEQYHPPEEGKPIDVDALKDSLQ